MLTTLLMPLKLAFQQLLAVLLSYNLTKLADFVVKIPHSYRQLCTVVHKLQCEQDKYFVSYHFGS